jgi:hypothetical protein
VIGRRPAAESAWTSAADNDRHSSRIAQTRKKKCCIR